MIIFLLKWLPFLAKFGGAAKWLAFIPGGQVFAVIGGVISGLVSAVTWLVKWACADIADGLKEPQRLVVRFACLFLALGFGLYEGVRIDRYQVEAARAEVAQMKQVWKDRDDEDARKAAHARAAREQAEREAAVAAEVAPSPPAAAAVVRAKRKPAAAAKSQGLFGGLFANPK